MLDSDLKVANSNSSRAITFIIELTNDDFAVQWDKVSLFNGISTPMGYLMQNPSFQTNVKDIIWPISKRYNGVHAFPKGITPEVNIIPWQEFELTNLEAAVQCLNYFATETTPFLRDKEFFLNEILSYLPTPPLGQDMTQGWFLSGV